MSGVLHGLVLGLLEAGPASIQALAARLDAPLPDVRKLVYGMAADGEVEGAGRGEAGALNWRLKSGAGAARPQRVRAKPGGDTKTARAAPAPPRAIAPAVEPPKLRASPDPAPRKNRVRQLQPGLPWDYQARREAPVVRLKPLTAEKRRFCGWFLDAGWPPGEVAHLFDVDVDALAEVAPA